MILLLSLQFGTPEEVAARVVTAEVNRDGVFEVTLLEDPYETQERSSSDTAPTTTTTTTAYILQYLSVGKRGNKHYFNKIVISKNQLYVLTAQVKQEDYTTNKDLADEMKRIVTSFQVSTAV